MERRLAAILITDMVGYSRLMALDEAEVFARQRKLRSDLIDTKIHDYGGRIIKSTGDGLLVMFQSAVDALRCAVMLQFELVQREALRPEDERLVYRIGVNMGDIILDDGDLYGDGVNVAARLVPMAEPGGICVTETVVNHVKGRVASDFEFLGERALKNIPDPIKLYKVDMVAERAAEKLLPLQVGNFEVDPRNGLITDGNGEIVHIRKQSQKVLAELAGMPNQLVSKDSLIDAVWGEIATTDDSLIQCITNIRKTLGKDAIETFPKKGYLLRTRDTKQALLPEAKATRRFGAIATSLAAVLAFVVLVIFWQTSGKSDKAQITDLEISTSQKSLAVLPFTNLSGDPNLRFFSNGLSEDLTTDLSKLADLTVISFSSSADFDDTDQGFGEIAQSLGAHYLVRGTVRHHGERVRINVSLIDARTSNNLWAERYDRDILNPFDVQSEVARSVAETLSLTLVGDPSTAADVQPEAYYMLLRGLEAMRANSAAGNAEARRYFEQALEFDADYSRAYANIAISYGRETEFRYDNEISKEEILKGLEAAITAVRLDPSLPDAYFALGVLNLALNDFDKALAAARHSIKLDKNYSDGYALLAEAGVYGGDLTEALAAIRKAKLLHPRHPATYDWVEGHILFQLEEYEEAKVLLDATVEKSPEFLRPWFVLAAANSRLSEPGEAAVSYRQVQRLLQSNGSVEPREIDWYAFEDRANRLQEGFNSASQNE
ncbi:winged helix-turn-helix domain-containing protein [Shimia abyssi]|uniref:TolB-like protein n=1 Tax=Shimia abyssi TaxID=1662395 RepID=A0A2P8EVV3_9RHOB|nr:winged helix-turn-helix domain-containing protein [Shimia abyssi]PSL13589.1 TolB-like protein [Shimia abyssi]